LKYLKLTPGSVTPLGLLNDEENAVHFYLDETFLSHKIGVHPNDNTATIWLDAEDLIRILKDHGTEVNIVEI
jgi:Ala-tRNA(Pro) deacylase